VVARPRLVLFPQNLHVPASLKRTLNSGCFRFTFDQAFGQVIRACATAPRPDQDGTWILPEMVQAYEALHALGIAHSAEAWLDGELAGGVYGVALGSAFFGESMFCAVSNASKALFATLVRWLGAQGCTLIDCQQTTAHLLRFGAQEIPRREFLARLRDGLQSDVLEGTWRFSET